MMPSTRAIRAWFRWRLRPQFMRMRVPFSGNRVLPDFLLVGAAKSGTTTLFHYLTQHPGILPPSVKEVSYFHEPQNFSLGPNWYRAHFPRLMDIQHKREQLGYRVLTCDATPSMNINSHAINASALVPDARLIMILRNPVDRTYSHYQHQKHKLPRESLSFWDALQAEAERTADDQQRNIHDPQHVGRLLRRFGYTHKSKYINQIEYWLQYFSREQLKIVSFDALQESPGKLCNELCQHIGLPEFDFDTSRKMNEGGYSKPMDDRSREYLTELFRPFNRRLFDFLGEDWGWPS
jgi:hypothetical protein